MPKARVERCGKSAPRSWQQLWPCKPHLMQDQVKRVLLTQAGKGAPPRFGRVARADRQLTAQIDGCPRQNSAYRLAHKLKINALCVRLYMEMYSSGRRGSPAKGIGRETGAEVQILSSPNQASLTERLRKLFLLGFLLSCLYKN